MFIFYHQNLRKFWIFTINLRHSLMSTFYRQNLRKIRILMIKPRHLRVFTFCCYNLRSSRVLMIQLTFICVRFVSPKSEEIQNLVDKLRHLLTSTFYRQNLRKFIISMIKQRHLLVFTFLLTISEEIIKFDEFWWYNWVIDLCSLVIAKM